MPRDAPRSHSSTATIAALGLLCVPRLAAQVPDALVGIWKGVDVPAEFANSITGAGIALSGWFGQLKLRADGSYDLEEYREGALGSCRISLLRRSRGTARTEATVLALAAASGSETKRDACNAAGSYTDRPITPAPERFTVTLSWTETLAGWTTLKLALRAHDRDGESYVLEAVHDPNPPWPAVQAAPERGDAPPPALIDLWSWPSRVAPTFRPGPGAFEPPPEDAMWIRLSADGRYEWVGWRASLVPGPGCTRGVMVQERGRYSLTVGEYDWQNTLTTAPDAGVVVERVSACGADDGEQRTTLSGARSRYQWSIGRTVDGEEVLEIKCSNQGPERTEWQFALCHWGPDFRALLGRHR